MKREHRKGRVAGREGSGGSWEEGGGNPNQGFVFFFEIFRPLKEKFFCVLVRSQILLNHVSEAEQQILSGGVPERRRKVEHLVGTEPTPPFLSQVPSDFPTELKCVLPI